MTRAMRRSRVGVHLSLPTPDMERAATVLAAAVAMFGPHDFVEFYVTPAGGGAPSESDAATLRALCTELAAPYGEAPPITLASAAAVANEPVCLSLDVTGDPVQDAKAILVLNGLARRLGSAYGRTADPDSLYRARGGSDLARVDAAAAQLRRGIVADRDPNGPVRVVVLLRQVHYWGAVQTLVEACLEHPDVTLDIVTLEDPDALLSHRTLSFRESLLERGLEVRNEAWLLANLRRVDVLISPEGYDVGRPPGLESREIAAAGVRLVLSPYAQALSGDPRNKALLFNMPVHNVAWRVYAASPAQVAIYGRECEAGNEHVRHLGNVKRERLLTDERTQIAAKQLRQRLRTQSVVLWNAHFEDPYGLSTFRKNLGTIVTFLREHPRRGIIFRPHPLLLPEYERAGGQAKQLAGDFRKLCAELPNVHLDESPDAGAAMLASDAMISDLSSLIPEYLVLNRPTAYLRQSPDVAINEDRDFLDQVVTVDDERGLTRFLMNPVRPAGAPTDSHADVGAGRRIVQAIVDDFRLEEFGIVPAAGDAVA